ncbi:hypothetical protein [Salibacterium lacus]|uniref:Uncharacterized protein n=1 Tax=Salibacterium lacus TaxID=1898109 RepID=A0ABW5T0G6_9BACI
MATDTTTLPAECADYFQKQLRIYEGQRRFDGERMYTILGVDPKADDVCGHPIRYDGEMGTWFRREWQMRNDELIEGKVGEGPTYFVMFPKTKRIGAENFHEWTMLLDPSGKWAEFDSVEDAQKFIDKYDIDRYFIFEMVG